MMTQNDLVVVGIDVAKAIAVDVCDSIAVLAVRFTEASPRVGANWLFLGCAGGKSARP